MTYSKPIILTATQTLQANSEDGVNAMALMNPTAEPMEILQMNFTVQAPAGVYISANAVGVKLDLGNIALTNNTIPLGMLGPARQIFTEEPASDTQTLHNWYHWPLSRPLYIEPGQTVIPVFKHRGLVTNDLVVRVAYLARSYVGKRPRERAVPWAAFYASKSFTVSSASADTDNSRETDLQNATGAPLIVDRFIGRIVGYLLSAGAYHERESSDNIADFGRRLLEVRMRDSDGNQVIRDWTPFRLPFNASTRSLETRATLRPGGYYSVNLQKLAESTGTNLLAQALVSMTGYRMVRI